ncbi:MAG: hypothetical protein IJI05_00925 [Erysipelotrichaceae bacterium]|nr:hypothetical protein [Erysipelotrichaceae bacterium]
MKRINEYELLYLARQRNEEAFNLLLELYKPMFYSIYGKIHKPNDTFRIEDAMQAACIGLYHAVFYYREDQKMAFHNFVNLCASREMKAWRKKEISSNYIDSKPILSLDYELKDSEGISFYETIGDRSGMSSVEAIVGSKVEQEHISASSIPIRRRKEKYFCCGSRATATGKLPAVCASRKRP